MDEHQYTPVDALELLLKKLHERDESLATEIREAIDEGKDISEPDPQAV